MTRLPAALVSATALQRLRLAQNPQLELAPSDLTVLQRMRSLSQLEVSQATLDDVPRQLRDWLGPCLQVVSDCEPFDMDGDE